MKKQEKKRFKYFYEGRDEKKGKKVKPYKRKNNRNLNDYLDDYK